MEGRFNAGLGADKGQGLLFDDENDIEKCTHILFSRNTST